MESATLGSSDQVAPGELVNDVRVRFADGELQGRTLWVEKSCATLRVRMATLVAGGTRTLLYRREGPFLRFVAEQLGPSILPAGLGTP